MAGGALEIRWNDFLLVELLHSSCLDSPPELPASAITSCSAPLGMRQNIGHDCSLFQQFLQGFLSFNGAVLTRLWCGLSSPPGLPSWNLPSGFYTATPSPPTYPNKRAHPLREAVGSPLLNATSAQKVAGIKQGDFMDTALLGPSHLFLGPESSPAHTDA